MKRDMRELHFISREGHEHSTSKGGSKVHSELTIIDAIIHSEQSTSERPPAFIDVFAGCGGLSLGLVQAGWTGLFGIEIDPMAFKTYSCNLLHNKRFTKFKWPEWLPISEISMEDILQEHRGNLESLRGKVEMIVGGPPCQGFSTAGLRRENDPRNSLIDYFVDLVKLIRPKLLLVENVRGIQLPFTKGKSKTRVSPPHSEILSSRLRDSGYLSVWELLEAQSFGVAQTRPRSFLLGIRDDLISSEAEFAPAKAIYEARVAMLQAKGLPLNASVGVSEAISDLETMRWYRGMPKPRELKDCPDSRGFKQLKYVKPRTSYQRILHKGMNGETPSSMRLVNHRPETKKRFQSILDNCPKGASVTRYLLEKWGTTKHCLFVLDPKKPSRTITTIPDDMIHYREPRVLTVRELARLQSFPDWFEFHGNYTTGGKQRIRECPRYTQVANAVPPFMAEAIGGALMKILGELTAASTQSKPET